MNAVTSSVGRRRKGRLKASSTRSPNMFLTRRSIQVLRKKAANLPYFLVKDHIFADGNKRIVTLLYLAFLHKNGMLLKEGGGMAIANDGLAARTILIAESKPEEKEIMVAVTMNMTGK